MKTIEKIAYLFILLLLATFVIVFGHLITNMTLQQEWASMITATIFAFAGCFILWIVKRQQRIESGRNKKEQEEIEWLKKLSFEENCLITAYELKNGTRQWYINYFPGSLLFFAPLKRGRWNEYGHGKRTPATKERIEKLLEKGLIANVEMTKGVLSAFNK